MFGQLREYGGRSSQIMAPIVVRQPLPLNHRQQPHPRPHSPARNLTGERQIVSQQRCSPLTDLRDIEEQFFGDGLGLFDGWSRKAAFRATIR